MKSGWSKAVIVSSALVLFFLTACGFSPAGLLKYAIWGQQASSIPFEYTTYKVAYGDFPVFVNARGRVECIKEYNVTTPDKIYGARIEKLAEEGRIVESGEVVCKLDTRMIEMNVERAISQLANAETELEEVKNANMVEELTKRSEIAKKQIQYEVNLFKLFRLREGADTIETAISGVEIEKNIAFIENFKSKLSSQKELLKRGFLSSFQFEDMELEYQKNQLELEKNRNRLVMLRKSVTPEEIRKYEILTRKNEMDETLARDAMDTFVRVNRLEEDKKKLDIKQKKHRLKLEQDVIANAEIAAPIAGTLQYASTWMGKTRIGMEVWSGLGILKVVDLSRMKVVVQVNEKYIDRFRENSKASIIFSALPGRPAGGFVKSVSKLAKLRDAGDPKGPKEFDVTIYIEGTVEIKLLPGMSADVSILCETLNGVSKVPRDFAPGSVVRLAAPASAELKLEKSSPGAKNEKPAVVFEDDDYLYVKGLPQDAAVEIPGGSGETGENGIKKSI